MATYSGVIMPDELPDLVTRTGVGDLARCMNGLDSPQQRALTLVFFSWPKPSRTSRKIRCPIRFNTAVERALFAAPTSIHKTSRMRWLGGALAMAATLQRQALSTLSSEHEATRWQLSKRGDSVTVFAISDDPFGGSASALPSGAMLFTGKALSEREAT